MKALLTWLALFAAGAALGLALAALQNTFGIPKPVMQGALAVLLAIGLAAAVWAGWRYFRNIAKDDDWP